MTFRRRSLPVPTAAPAFVRKLEVQPDSEFGVAELRVLARGEPHVAGKNELAAHAAHAGPDSCEAGNRRFR